MSGTEWMQSVSISSIAGSVVLILVLFITFYLKNNKNLPPGPWGLPLVGYLPFLGRYPEITLTNLTKKYGSIMSLYMGTKLAIVLGDYNIIQEAYIKSDDFNGKPVETMTKIFSNDTGVASAEGELWKIQRRFIIKKFREFGMGKLSLEPQIQEEIRYFLGILAAAKDHPIDPSKNLNASVANVVGIIQCGTRFQYSDKNFIHLANILSELPKHLHYVGLRGFMPWTRFIPFIANFTEEKQLHVIKRQATKIFDTFTEEHMKSLTDGNCTNYIDAYLHERNRTIEKTGSEGYFTLKTLNDNLFELFIGGMDTISITLRWTMLYLMLHPDVQKKLQNEIDEIIGMERYPSTNDRPNMVYTEAVLLETHRIASIVPTNLLHSNEAEATLAGYRIPKRSFIIALLKAVHTDPTIWKDPEVFRPERFIQDGKLKKSQYVIPFSIGKRACLGESLAKMELFLYLTSIFQRFTLKFPADFVCSLKQEPGAFRAPKAFLIRAIERTGYVLS